jgi:hypothetical protein
MFTEKISWLYKIYLKKTYVYIINKFEKKYFIIFILFYQQFCNNYYISIIKCRIINKYWNNLTEKIMIYKCIIIIVFIRWM